MGKYTKKHIWMPCEFVYKTNFNGRKPGETCDAPTRKNYNGKYLCNTHNPKRRLMIRCAELKKNARLLVKEESRLKAQAALINFLEELRKVRTYEQAVSLPGISINNPVIS